MQVPASSRARCGAWEAWIDPTRSYQLSTSFLPGDICFDWCVVIIQSCFWIMISASGSKCVQSNWLFTSEGLPSIFDHASLSSSYHSVKSSGGSVASLWSHQEVSISLCEPRPRLFTRLPMSWGCAVRDCQVLACFGSRPKGGNTMCTKQQVNYGRKEHRGKQL